MRIRPANAYEIDLVAKIHETTATAAYSHIFAGQPFPREESLARWRSFPGKILLAEVDSTVRGFVAFDETELHALYVLPEYEGCGIGSRLLADAKGVTSLWVLKENRAARRFYEFHGWIPTGHERGACGVIEMQYRLCRQT